MADYWIKARYSGKCSECGCDIIAGERILYSPNDNKGMRDEVYCEACGLDIIAEDNEIEVD